MSSSKWTGPGPSLDSSRRCSLSAKGRFRCLQIYATELNHMWQHSLRVQFYHEYSYKILTQHSNIYFILSFLYYMYINTIINMCVCILYIIYVYYTYIYIYIYTVYIRIYMHIILYILILSLSILCQYIKQDKN